MKRLLLLISIFALVLLPTGCVDMGGTIGDMIGKLFNVFNMEGTIGDMIEELFKALTSTYTIKVDGTAELNFSGEYMEVNADYDPENRVAFTSDPIHVEGQVPKQYTVTDAAAVAGMFQKQTEEGTLRVEIWRGGDLIATAETTDPWGAVLVMSTEEE